MTDLILGNFDKKYADIVIGTSRYLIRDITEFTTKMTCGINLSRLILVEIKLADLDEDCLAGILPCLMNDCNIPPSSRLVEVEEIDLRGIQWQG